MDIRWRTFFDEGKINFERLIASVVIATALVWIFYFTGMITGASVGHWWQYAALPGDWHVFVRRPWSIITYAWIHTGLVDFLINLLLLYYIGNMFLTYESEKKLMRLFWTGIVAGGLAFLITRSFADILYKDEPYAYLTGISAGYMVWLAYLAAKYGDYETYVRLVGRIKIKYLFYFFVALDLILLTAYNSGGHVAHLAASLTGWLWAKAELNLSKSSVAPSTSRGGIYDNFKPPREKAIDRILEKINRSGFDSLTPEEKEILHKESRRNTNE